MIDGRNIFLARSLGRQVRIICTGCIFDETTFEANDKPNAYHVGKWSTEESDRLFAIVSEMIRNGQSPKRDIQ